MFNQPFPCRLDGKYRSATAPLVLIFSFAYIDWSKLIDIAGSEHFCNRYSGSFLELLTKFTTFNLQRSYQCPGHRTLKKSKTGDCFREKKNVNS